MRSDEAARLFTDAPARLNALPAQSGQLIAGVVIHLSLCGNARVNRTAQTAVLLQSALQIMQLLMLD